MKKSVLIVAICSLAFGVGLRSVHEISFSLLVCLLSVSFATALIWRRKSSIVYVYISVLLIMFVLGVLRTDVASQAFGDSPLSELTDTDILLAGTVVSEPDMREKSLHIQVQTDTDKVLVTTDRHTDVAYGDSVSVSGRLQKPESFTTDLGRTFNYPGYLQAKGIEYSISFANVEVIDSGYGNPVIALLLSAKQAFLGATERVIPEPAAGLGSGLLLGVKSALGEDIENDFRKTGIIHIVVLSGYNVMLVATFMLFVLSYVMSPRWRLVAGIISIVAFALVVGLSATVVRASIMAILVLIAQTFGKQYDVMRALLFAGAIMLLINPYLLMYDIGFQLSFMATLGLILIVPHFESKGITGSNIFGMRDFFFATISTQIAVLPLLMYHIGEVSIVSVVVNMLVLPMVPIAMLLTFITGLVGLVSSTIASIFGFAALLSLNYILLIAKWFAALPFAAITVPQFSFLGVALLYIVFAGVYGYIIFNTKNVSSTHNWKIVDEEKETELSSDKNPKKESVSNQDVPILFR